MENERQTNGILEDKVCIVTGGAGSLGLASAAAFLREGGRVMLVDVVDEGLEQAATSLDSDKERVGWISADVSSTTDTQRYIAHTVKTFGKVDVLFLNAGVSGELVPVSKLSEASFDKVMAVNVRGVFLGCKYGLPQMNDGGSIVITSSIMGVTAAPLTLAYATSKHAVIGMMRSVAKEVAPRNIRVNVVAPGPIDNSFQLDIEDRISERVGVNVTERLNNTIPLGRHSQPAEVAETVLFLASDRSSFSTGSVFMSDGGMHA